MKARIANYGDVNSVVQVCRHQHEKSSWQDLPFSPQQVRRNLARMIRTDGMDVLVVADDTGKLTGVLLATVDQFFMNKMWYATDAHFMCDSGGIQLLAKFKQWAREHPASKIIMGIANDDPSGRVHEFYAAVGMQQVGDAWVMDLQDTQEIAA